MKLQEDPEIIKKFDEETRNFYNFHGIQLLGSKFPVHLIPQLKHKLYNKIYDGGQYFNILDNPDKETFEVHAIKDIKKEQDVFLIDHTISFRYPELRELLKKNPGIVQRLDNLTKYLGNKQTLSAQAEAAPSPFFSPLSLQFEYMSLESLDGVQIPVGTVCLSLMGNNLASEQEITNLLKKLPELKALWLNQNPLQSSENVRNFIEAQTKIQVYNSKFTKNTSSWGLKYVTHRDLSQAADNNVQPTYLDVSGRDFFNKIQPSYLIEAFPRLKKINIKENQIEGLEQLNKLIALVLHPSLNYLEADLAVEKTLNTLYKSSTGPLKDKLRRLLVNSHNLYIDEPTEQDEVIDRIHSRIFQRSGCYRLASTEKLDETSIWYINDQLGSSLTHSDHPEVVVCPFLFAQDNKMGENVTSFSIMWVVKDLVQGQVVERDYLNGLGENKFRSSRLAVWYSVPRQHFKNYFYKYQERMNQITSKFLAQKEQLLKQALEGETSPLPKKQFTVLTDSHLITQYLTHPAFKTTTTAEGADILWADTALSEDLQTIKKENGLIVNQFPFEACLVMKNNLANTIQSTLGNTKFLQRTYDLETDLPVFIGQYFENSDQNNDNIWISKPPNMARSMDMLVSDNLDILIRNMETGPKLVQKYISNPVKRLNRKIDLRFIVVMRSVKPLEVFLYKHFWIRTSNNEYNLDCRYREQYQTHFTVMNYGKKLTQVNYPDFIEQFNQDYKPRGVDWTQVYAKMCEMLRMTFLAAATKYPEMHSTNSRAMYGVDVMIDETDFEPKLLEFTFSPDCNRACKFYPTFFNDVFETLFLGEKNINFDSLF